MAGLTNRSVQLTDPVLSNLAIQWRPQGFIADQICPRIDVATETGLYPVWEAHHFFATDVNPLVPDRAETKEVDAEVSKAPYVAEEYALKSSISEREARQASSMLNLRQAKQNLVLDRLALHREKRVAELLNTKDATPAGQLDNAMDDTPSNNWNVDAGAIEADIVKAKEAIYDKIGTDPNTIVIPYKVANAIATQQDIREIFKYTVDGRQLLGAGANILPPEIWGLRVLIPRARRISSAEGQTNTYADVWGTDVRVLYVNPSPDTEQPSVAYTIQARGRETRTWRTNDPNVEYLRVSDGIYDERVVCDTAGYVIKAVI